MKLSITTKFKGHLASLLAVIYLSSINPPVHAQITEITRNLESSILDSLSLSRQNPVLLLRNFEKRYNIEDSIPKIIKVGKEPKDSVLWRLNGKPLSSSAKKSLRTDKIVSMTVKKDLSEAERELFRGIIDITYEDSYRPKFQSLQQIATTYELNPKNQDLIFLLNGVPIFEAHSEFEIDEKFILKIETYVNDGRSEEQDLIIANIISRTKENVAKANAVYIK